MKDGQTDYEEDLHKITNNIQIDEKIPDEE